MNKKIIATLAGIVSIASSILSGTGAMAYKSEKSYKDSGKIYADQKYNKDEKSYKDSGKIYADQKSTQDTKSYKDDGKVYSDQKSTKDTKSYKDDGKVYSDQKSTQDTKSYKDDGKVYSDQKSTKDTKPTINSRLYQTTIRRLHADKSYRDISQVTPSTRIRR
jgi:hypothetical protein